MKISFDTENQLIQSILHGEPKSARKFYRLYHRPLKLFIKQRTKCEEDAEEIVQDVFLSAIESLGMFSGRSKLITWLYGIARHEIADYYRKKRVKTLMLSHVPLIKEIIGDKDWRHKHEQIFLEEQVKQVLKRINPRYAQVLKMKYLEGWSVIDMAKELNESFKATETALFRARKAFALEWTNLYEES